MTIRLRGTSRPISVLILGFIFATLLLQMPQTVAQEAETQTDIPRDELIGALVDTVRVGLESSALQQRLLEFGLTPETVGDIVSTRLSEELATSVGSLTTDIVVSMAAEIVADELSEAIMDSSLGRRLPQSLKNPTEALIRSTVTEGFGLGKTILVDGQQLGPFALVVPVMNRIEDAVEIVEAANMVNEERTTALVAVAMGAEITAQLERRYPSQKTSEVVAQWKRDTLANLRGISGGDIGELSQVLELGYSALAADNNDVALQQLLALIDNPDLRQSSGDVGALGSAVNFISRTDPTDTLIEAFLRATSLGDAAAQTTNQPEEILASEPVVWRAEPAPLESSDQNARRNQICERYREVQGPVPGTTIVSELRGLTDYHRQQALGCMLKRVSYVIPVATQAEITGRQSSDHYRTGMICNLVNYLPANQSASAIAAYLDQIEGYKRFQAIRCLTEKLQDGTPPDGILAIMGPLQPERAGDWDGTLANYDESTHRSAMCAVAAKIAGDISAEEASDLLGLSRDYPRSQTLRCIVGSIEMGLSWEDVGTIVGPSIRAIGRMIDTLGTRSPDGFRVVQLVEFLERYPRNGRFLVDGDPPAWLAGQCVAFVRLAYERVATDENNQALLNNQVGTAANLIATAERLGIPTETDPTKGRVGSIAVWATSDGVGHAGIVTAVNRNNDSGDADGVTIAEANWGRITEAGAEVFGIDLETARREFVTEMYGRYGTTRLRTDAMDRNTEGETPYRFIGYVMP